MKATLTKRGYQHSIPLETKMVTM